MKYVRTKDRIVTDNIATHELTESICDAGYLKTLKKGSLCKIGKTWWNYYGNWTSIIDENGMSYDIRPNEVDGVVKELPSADIIEELCDAFVKKSKEIGNDYFEIGKNALDIFDRKYHKEDLEHYAYYGAIWTDKGLIYVVKMNDKGELELL